MNLTSLAPGSVIRFAAGCALPQLASKKAEIQAVRTYCFGTDVTISYQLSAEGQNFFLAIAEDNQGYYLAITRELPESEQDRFFGRDALGFFTEQSSAKTIRCKADLVIEGAWLGPRYSKVVDWMAGTITQGRLSTATPGGKQTRQFHYNQLVDESGEKTLEIEHYEDGAHENRIYVTVYRPVEDIASVAEPVPHIPAPAARPAAKPAPQPQPEAAPAAINGHGTNGHHAAAVVEQPLFSDPKSRMDFRRRSEDEGESIHIGRTPTTAEKPPSVPAEIPPLPSFLLSRENNYMSLDEIITPETENIRCDLISTKLLIDTALKRRVHVKDILRELLGLDSGIRDEAVFELPLSDTDYRALAMRYRLKPDRRQEIRLCLQEELRLKLMAIAKN